MRLRLATLHFHARINFEILQKHVKEISDPTGADLAVLKKIVNF